MTQYAIETRSGLPTEMQALLREHPRDTWPGNPDFAASIRNWMGAHVMFRDLARIIRDDTERFLDKEMEQDLYVARLGYFGDRLVRNLHGHHHWEDRSFFPELSQADPRFERGLEMLESDHVALDGLLDGITGTANRLIKLDTLDPAQVPDEAGRLHETTARLGAFLDRHLTDEEDLAVPILLHHRLRG